MKKLSNKQKYRFLLRIKKAEKKKLKKKRGTQITNKTPSQLVKIDIPQRLDLLDSFEESVNFFSQIRKISSDKFALFSINFKTLKNISPAAALIFAAEMDRVRIIRGSRLKVVDFNKWDNHIKTLLGAMGMYDLLNLIGITDPFSSTSPAPAQNGERFIKFQTGEKADGQNASQFKEAINNVIGKNIPNNKALQKSLTEAMTNVSNHAYPEEYLSQTTFKQKRWWMSASFNNTTNKLTIIFYDQGVGIPTSITKTASESFKSLINLFSDGKKISALMKYGRSRTNEPHRGKGLHDIKNYIASSNIGNSYFKIYSERGLFVYSKQQECESENTYDKRSKLKGTLIEWQICLNQ